jgi:hypothetical protein
MGEDKRSSDGRPPIPRVGHIVGAILAASTLGLVWMHASIAKPIAAQQAASSVWRPTRFCRLRPCRP